MRRSCMRAPRSPADEALTGNSLRPRSASLLLAALLCVPLALIPSCDRPPSAPKLLVIGIDGADWRMVRPLISAGELPHLERIMREGVHGPLWSLKPTISPLIWTTIATGKGPDQHGVLDFTVPDPSTGRMVVVTSQVRRSKAFWNILSEQGLRVCLIGWWASWPAEPVSGVIVSDRLNYHAFIKSPEAAVGLVHPADQLPGILRLREQAADVPHDVARQFIHVSAEEYYAAPELDFYDPVSHFRHIHQTMTTHASIAEYLVHREHFDVVAVYFEGVDTAGHMYMRYAPPALPHTTEAERRKFGQTVAAFYRLQDRLLGELLELTDENTTVLLVSDHGFLIGPERPVEEQNRFDYATAARWHRLEGVIAMMGPQVKSANIGPGMPTPFTRSSVFDITPTILALLGLPAAQDMDGRVLSEMLVDEFAVPPRIATYEDEAWRENRRTARAAIGGVDEEIQERLRSLGYIGAADTDATLSLWAQWSLAQYYLFRNEIAKARRELDQLLERDPDWPDTYWLLGVIHTQQQEYAQAREMYEKVLELNPREVEARLNLAFVYRQLGMLSEGLALLEEAAAEHPYRTDIPINAGILRRELGDLDAARAEFEKVLRLDPGSHPAHAQLGLVCEDLGDSATAADHWAEAVRLNPTDRTAREHLAALREQGYAPSRP